MCFLRVLCFLPHSSLQALKLAYSRPDASHKADGFPCHEGTSLAHGQHGMHQQASLQPEMAFLINPYQAQNLLNLMTNHSTHFSSPVKAPLEGCTTIW